MPPVKANGVGPDPAVTAAAPIWLFAEQVPAFASVSPQKRNRGDVPEQTRGHGGLRLRDVLLAFTTCEGNLKDVNAPATEDWFSVLCAGANGNGAAHAPPVLLLSTVNGALVSELLSVWAAVEDQGVSVAEALAGPQLSGFASGARVPPLNVSFTELSGNCGFSSNVVTS